MEYSLQDLLRVRELRKDNAQLELVKAHEALKIAERVVEESKKALYEYQQWRPGEEKRLYDKIMQKQVTIEKVDDVKDAIKQLYEKETELAQKIQEAEKKVLEAIAFVETKQKALAQANKDVDKLLEHKKTEIKAYQKEEERVADSELDEFKPRKG